METDAMWNKVLINYDNAKDAILKRISEERDSDWLYRRLALYYDIKEYFEYKIWNEEENEAQLFVGKIERPVEALTDMLADSVIDGVDFNWEAYDDIIGAPITDTERGE